MDLPSGEASGKPRFCDPDAQEGIADTMVLRLLVVGLLK
jgi:hypothetical protein